MKKAFIIVAINITVFIILIISIEILCQFIYFTKNHNFLFLESSVNHKLFEIHPFLAGRLRESVVMEVDSKTIKTTDSHTRWTGGNQDDNSLIRVAVLGGSTAFGTGVTDEDSWPALLQTKLGKKFSVINYGVPGYSTVEAIIQMALIIPEKRPHVVIFYEGWNDIRNYHERKLGSDYYGHGIRQYSNLGIPIFVNDHSTYATLWLINSIKHKITKSPEKNMDIRMEPDPFVDKMYIRNLKTLKLLTENIHASAVFVPQVLNYSLFHGKESSRRWSRHIKDDVMPILMERFNSHMEGLCSQRDEKCVVVREVTKEKWSPDDFVDDGHFSKKGGLRFSEIVAKYVSANTKVKYERRVIPKVD
jgi:hypothetical protein